MRKRRPNNSQYFEKQIEAIVKWRQSNPPARRDQILPHLCDWSWPIEKQIFALFVALINSGGVKDKTLVKNQYYNIIFHNGECFDPHWIAEQNVDTVASRYRVGRQYVVCASQFTHLKKFLWWFFFSM